MKKIGSVDEGAQAEPIGQEARGSHLCSALALAAEFSFSSLQTLQGSGDNSSN